MTGQRATADEGSVSTVRSSWRSRVVQLGRDGTGDILVGSVVAGAAGLAYEVIGGRSLGTEGFAPVSALLTLHFLAFVVVLIPLEQVTIRRLTLDAGRPGIPVGAVSVISMTALGTGVAAFVLRGRLFAGDGIFAALVVATVLTHGVFALARGYLAGRRRFRSYGMASGTAGVLRVAVAGVVVAVSAGAAWFGLALAIGPLVVLAWRAFSGSVDEVATGRVRVVDTAATEGRYVAGLMLASAASQALLLAGPVVAAFLGATAATVSIVFVTFTVARAPLSLGYNLVARLVPPLTRIAARGEQARLARIARLVGVVTLVLGPVAYGAGATLGPKLIAFVFGEAFRPDSATAGMVGAGVVVAAGALVVGQIFVARGDTHLLADAWLAAIFAGVVALLLPLGDPALRVGAAFVAGEGTALLILVAAARHLPRRHSAGEVSRRLLYPAAKRVLDVGVAVAALIGVFPLMALVAVAVRVGSGRPVLFGQTRVGRGGRMFRLWKFRTMAVDGDPEVFGAHLAELRDAGADGEVDLHIPNDPRVTAVGRFLRRWSLDELPNLWNVVAGDVSLVGPRPLLAEEVAVIASEIGDDAARRRADVPPGITGLAQVEGRDDIGLAERSALDLRYVRERSLSLDLWILARTAVSVVRHRGL